MLDGHHASSFAALSGATFSGDINIVTTTGWATTAYLSDSSSSIWVGIHSSNLFAIFDYTITRYVLLWHPSSKILDLTDNADMTLTKNSNTIWHAGNDGTGSGLDADFLDGTHLSGLVLQGTVSGTTAGTNWGSGTPAFVADQKRFPIVLGGVTYWIPLWASS